MWRGKDNNLTYGEIRLKKVVNHQGMENFGKLFFLLKNDKNF